MAFSITATPPAYMVGIRAKAAHNSIFLAGSAVVLDFSAWAANGSTATATPQAFTGSWYLRSYYGTLVTSGTLTGATSINLGSSLPCGWYRLHLTQGTSDATYGTAAGAGQFSVVPANAHFPTITTAQDSGKRGQFGDDCIVRGVTGICTYRNALTDPTNSSYETSAAANRVLDASWYNSVADPVRPRPSYGMFTSGLSNPTWATAAVPVIQRLYDNSGIEYYEVRNEPNFAESGSATATEMQNFYNTVKSARTGAKAVGPAPVNISENLIQMPGPPTVSTSYWHNFGAAVAAMNPVPLDAISFHAYNSVLGDLSLGRRSFDNLVSVLTEYGLQNLPRFHSEQGYFALNSGVLTPRQQAQWTMQLILLQEQYNVPKEHFMYFTMADTSDYTYPSEMTTGDCNAFPLAAMGRTLSAEVYGKAFTAALDFGSPGNDMMLGSRYTDPNTGDQLLALQAAGSTDLAVDLTVTGASTLTTVDCFGNTGTVTVTAGKASVPTAMEPVYVRVPSGVTAVPMDMWNAAALGPNLAVTVPAVATASGTSGNVTANAARMVDGKQSSTYGANPGAAITRTHVYAPYVDDTTGFPAWAQDTWSADQSINTVIVFCAPLWGSGGSLLDFDVQWLDADGVTWHTGPTITESVSDGDQASSANVIAHVSHAQQGNSYVENYTPGRWIYLVKLSGTVTTKAIRVAIRNATYGMNPTIAAHNAMVSGARGQFGNVFTIRELQAFNAQVAAPPPTITRYLVARTS